MDSHITDFSDIDEMQKKVVFYINPYNNGAVFTRKEIYQYLKTLKKEPEPEYFLPASNESVIRELVYFMKMVYRRSGEGDVGAEMSRLLKVFGKQ